MAARLESRVVADEYESGAHRWWHLSSPSPELLDAIEVGWLSPPGRILDLGCGLGSDAAYLASVGFAAYGVDISRTALARAQELHPHLHLARADVCELPFANVAFDFLLDRGTFHYLSAHDRLNYAREAARVLRPSGRFLLRACLQSEGRRSAIGAETIRESFEGWGISSVVITDIPSDTRSMPALVVRLERR